MSGDEPTPEEPAILICNHQVDADWWFMWCWGKAFNKHGHVKIILKDTLKWVPVLGQGMQNFEFIFLARKLEEDKPNLMARLQTFVDDNFPFWFLIFPEGTTVHEEYIEKSQKFAEQTNRPVLHKTVLPRVNGLAVVLDTIPENTKVYDATMVYSKYTGDIPDWDDGYERKKDKEVPSLTKMFGGFKTPPTYIHMKASTAKEIKEQGIQDWLDKSWVEKDTVLSEYATTGKMPESICGTETREKVLTGSPLGILVLAALELLGAAGLAMLAYSKLS
eukprot:CAMPEP_0174284272 /NCGR_PEP_ID=MMETSP0809-20121228/5021_1 /TAXON_ID=73025 ORGANISM="Eutreptiella gymnastica-like, Strain CCMP1594" /NCGR_SAMPLE_ID=MMETSP0809 /ASSEMBLY_ACC=CAM_ASM_000658 /LENGTH=275 /DNA_ID=CAMNT_0015379697 /DNA_START=239 /DNA_END=1066 /DNA_ORIENTATION=-